MDLEGIIPPMITPTDGASVDRAQVGTFTDRLVDAGVHGLLPVGSVGEFPSLTVEQRGEVIETVVDHAGDCPVIAGCGGTSVATVRRQLDRASDAGADAGLVVTPYYFSTTQSGLQRFYREVAAGADLPILLYDIPQFTGSTLTPDTVASLAAEDGIIGLKDSTSDLPTLMATIDAVPTEFIVLQGNPALGIGSLEAGADGIVAGPANVVPAAAAEWYETYRRDEHAQTARIARDVIMPILQAKRDIPAPAAFKHLLSRAGVPVGEPLPPLQQASAAEREVLDACFEEIASSSRWTPRQ